MTGQQNTLLRFRLTQKTACDPLPRATPNPLATKLPDARKRPRKEWHSLRKPPGISLQYVKFEVHFLTRLQSGWINWWRVKKRCVTINTGREKNHIRQFEFTHAEIRNKKNQPPKNSTGLFLLRQGLKEMKEEKQFAKRREKSRTTRSWCDLKSNTHTIHNPLRVSLSRHHASIVGP